MGLLAQHESLTAVELERLLGLQRRHDLKAWLGRLPAMQLLPRSWPKRSTNTSGTRARAAHLRLRISGKFRRKPPSGGAFCGWATIVSGNRLYIK